MENRLHELLGFFSSIFDVTNSEFLWVEAVDFPSDFKKANM